MENKIIVAFHVGRGGRFYNAGHKTYVSGIHCLSDIYSSDSYWTIVDTDDEGNELPAEDWKLYDGGNNVILEGKDDIFAETGILDIDGDYDKWIVQTIEDCDDVELGLISAAIADGEIVDDDVRNYIASIEE